MKAKFFLSALVLVGLLLSTTGCKRDNMEDIEIITTSYPIEFVTDRLYGNHSLVNSIYPDGTDIRGYDMTKKQYNDYSKKELFIYNGLSSDREIATKLLAKNRDLKIIDSSFGMELTYPGKPEELWLNPSHLLMMAQNIRKGLKEYVNSTYLKKDIDDNYETLKVELSELDAEIKLTAENASVKTLVVSNSALKFLEKYGFNIISLEDDGTLLDKTVITVKELIASGQVQHIFMLEYDKGNDKINEIIEETKVATSTFRRLDNITDLERDNQDDYFTIMNKNIDLIKQELYR